MYLNTDGKGGKEDNYQKVRKKGEKRSKRGKRNEEKKKRKREKLGLQRRPTMCTQNQASEETYIQSVKAARTARVNFEVIAENVLNILFSVDVHTYRRCVSQHFQNVTVGTFYRRY